MKVIPNGPSRITPRKKPLILCMHIKEKADEWRRNDMKRILTSTSMVQRWTAAFIKKANAGGLTKIRGSEGASRKREPAIPARTRRTTERKQRTRWRFRIGYFTETGCRIHTDSSPILSSYGVCNNPNTCSRCIKNWNHNVAPCWTLVNWSCADNK